MRSAMTQSIMGVLSGTALVLGLSGCTDLRGITQNWDKKLDATNGDANGCNSDRFTCIFPDATHPDGAAVRDNETGLVWEREPHGGTLLWFDAIAHCAKREVSGRRGWAMPMREQLATLLDSSNTDPALPTGHPFLNVATTDRVYWTATRVVDRPDSVWTVYFEGTGNLTQGGATSGGSSEDIWCVRGGQAYDGQDVLNVIEALP